MARVTCRFTFLDVFLEGEERGTDVRAGRAQSAPPHAQTEQEDADSFEPTGLAPRCPAAVQAPDVQEPEHATESDSAMPEPPAGGRHVGPSAGSAGHPVLCKRPCVHVAAGRFCEAGALCDFCHLHHNRFRWLDRRQRQMLENLSKAEFLLLALQLLRAKVPEGLRGSEALLSALEGELGIGDQEFRDALRQLPAGLRRCLRRASFATLATWAAHRCTEGVRLQVQDALQVLRARGAVVGVV